MKVLEVCHKTEGIDNCNRETQTKINNQSSKNKEIQKKNGTIQAELAV